MFLDEFECKIYILMSCDRQFEINLLLSNEFTIGYKVNERNKEI